MKGTGSLALSCDMATDYSAVCLALALKNGSVLGAPRDRVNGFIGRPHIELWLRTGTGCTDSTILAVVWLEGGCRAIFWCAHSGFRNPNGPLPECRGVWGKSKYLVLSSIPQRIAG